VCSLLSAPQGQLSYQDLPSSKQQAFTSRFAPVVFFRVRRHARTSPYRDVVNAEGAS
jgi:hypothetical protein